jgi:hypothetical protein
VARAFALFADVTGQGEFRLERPGRCFRASRVDRLPRSSHADGYEIRNSMGIAERESPSTTPPSPTWPPWWCFTMRSESASAWVCGRSALASDRRRHGRAAAWQGVVSHDGYRKTEEKGATPDPLMGIWPFGFALAPEEEQATLDFYLDQADAYLGSPMLSALYGAWAARTGIGPWH